MIGIKTLFTNLRLNKAIKLMGQNMSNLKLNIVIDIK